MGTDSREKNQNFQDILRDYSNAVGAEERVEPNTVYAEVRFDSNSARIDDKDSGNSDVSYQTGADLGLGLLNELFFALKRPRRLPKDIRQNFQQNTEPQKVEPPPSTMKPLPPLSPAQKLALAFFLEHGEREPTSLTELKRSYRRLAKRLHPDAAVKATPSEAARLTFLFRKLRNSFEELSDYWVDVRKESLAA